MIILWLICRRLANFWFLPLVVFWFLQGFFVYFLSNLSKHKNSGNIFQKIKLLANLAIAKLIFSELDLKFDPLKINKKLTDFYRNLLTKLFSREQLSHLYVRSNILKVSIGIYFRPKIRRNNVYMCKSNKQMQHIFFTKKQDFQTPMKTTRICLFLSIG